MEHTQHGPHGTHLHSGNAVCFSTPTTGVLVGTAMEVQGSLGIHKLLSFDEDMFYAWCAYIGIMRAKLIWRETVTPETVPTMKQLLACVVFGNMGTMRDWTRESSKLLLKYIHVSQVRTRLIEAILAVKAGMDPWDNFLRCKCVYLCVAPDSSTQTERCFRVGDICYRLDTRVAKNMDGPWLQAAVIVGEEMHYYAMHQLQKFRNAWQLAMCNIPHLTTLPLDQYVSGNLGIVEKTTVERCEGSYMVLSDNTRLFNPRLPPGQTLGMANSLESTITLGQKCALPIGSIFWWYWPCRGGWFSFTVQHITPNLVYECMGANGEAIDARWENGQLKAFYRSRDGGTPLAWAKEPPVSPDVWTSLPDAPCSDGWGLDQAVRCDPPPNHQQSVDNYRARGSVARGVGVLVGDWVWCHCMSPVETRHLQYFAIVIEIHHDLVNLRIPWTPHTLKQTLLARDPASGFQGNDLQGWWQDISVSPTQLDTSFTVVGGTYPKWHAFKNNLMDRGFGTSVLERQGLIVLERQLKTSAMGGAWRHRMEGWTQEVAVAADQGVQLELLHELLCAVRAEIVGEVVWCVIADHNGIKAKLDGARDILEQAGALYAAYADIERDTPKLPTWRQLNNNWKAALQYSTAFPVRVQYSCTSRPFEPWCQYEEDGGINRFMRSGGPKKYVVIDVGAGVGSVKFAGRAIEQHIKFRGDGRELVHHMFENDEEGALPVLRKWFEEHIETGKVKLGGDMHHFDPGGTHFFEDIIHQLWISIECTYICSPGTQCDDGDVVAQVNRLVDPFNWACPGTGETHRQIQSALRFVNFALQSNPSVIINFENAESMPPAVALGIFRVFDGVARFHTVLNEANFSAVQRCRLRWGTHFVPAAIQFGGERSMWQSYLGSPHAGGLVALAPKALCITSVSQNSHYETNTLPLSCGSGAVPCCTGTTPLNWTVGDAHTTEKAFEARSNMYNPVRCPTTGLLKAMGRHHCEGMLGYFDGMTRDLGDTAAKKVLGKVFAVKSVHWVQLSMVQSVDEVQKLMVEKYKECINVGCTFELWLMSLPLTHGTHTT